jgi:FkbM family methyltransferase
LKRILRKLLFRILSLPDINKKIIDNMNQCIKGGTLLVAPKNLKAEYYVAGTSAIASRVIRIGEWEPELNHILERFERQEGFVVNVGANVGVFAVYISQTFHRCDGVFAIEPDPAAYDLLVRNIEHNGVGSSVRPVNTAIGDTEGTVDFATIEGKPEYSSMGSIVHPNVAGMEQKIVQVPVARLENVVKDAKTSLLLVDTEGAELLVFKGAEAVIRRDMPGLVFECSDILLQKFGHSSRALEELLKGYGYVVRNAANVSEALSHPFEGEAIAVHESMKDSLN